MFPQTDYKKLRSHAYNYGLSQGLLADHADDFAQYACLCILNNRKTHIYNIYIDFTRLAFGRTRKGYTKHRHDFLSATTFNELTIVPDIKPEHFDEFIEGLDPIDRLLIVLTYKWGFERGEIAHLFGFDRPSISFRFKKIIEDFKANERLKS